MNQIKITEGYKRCFELIDDDTDVILVSGEAGTGKSVLISQIEKRYPIRNILKVGPTGIASLNIGGQTIHSFFRLPIGVLTKRRMLKRIEQMMRYGSGAFDNLDMIIIEEISMVRSDVLDSINLVLQRMRRSGQPFGGVQIIMVGDLFQLPSIVTEEDREEFESLYDTEYFFGADVFKSVDMLGMMEVVMLNEVFRQSDPVFVNILNEIRVNKRTKINTKILNELCYYDPPEWDSESDIVLCMTNDKSNQINVSELRKIKSELRTYEATISEGFTVSSITPKSLTLKVGAKVMFTKNNSDVWVNGSMGIVTKLDDKTIEVEMDTGQLVTVEPATWEQIKIRFDNKLNTNVEEIAGTFKQFPLMLAWSVTVHKAQGLSFDRVTIDFGREAFAYGQVYVALSRCRSLDGLRFLRPLTAHDVKVDPRVVDFYKKIALEYTDENVTD